MQLMALSYKYERGRVRIKIHHRVHKLKLLSCLAI
jgi:hypothetical protein